MKAYIAELFGTFCLVFIGCASVVLGGFGALVPSGGVLAIGLAFGIAVVAMAYAIGSVSGAHLNPAVTLGAFLAGRLPAKDVAPYMIAQVAGGILGAIVLWIIASGSANGAPASLAATTWDPSAFSTAAVFLAEVVATFLFVMVILGVTTKVHSTVLGGLVIGLTLTAMHLGFVQVSGSSLNPARSIGPALFSGSTAIAQLWLYILAPLIGGAVAGVVYKARLFESTESDLVRKVGTSDIPH
ncbi:aquaporin [Chelativorans sp.]|uniref:aquaporin n=1 Tax=Chelativorans sp. TaxID=2203393 RepID=UPI002812753B|nr:aquaporin [Chelativorans sp.]